nr:MAG TPA: hypothetical protein [Caudoviricetes sp.]
MAIINPWTNPNKLTIRHRFSGEYIPNRFDKLITHFRDFVAKYVTKSMSDLRTPTLLNSDDIAYCNFINFNYLKMAIDIDKAITDNAGAFRFDRFIYLLGLLGENTMTKTSLTSGNYLIHTYKAPGIVFEVKVERDNNSEFDMSITLLDGCDESKPGSTKDSCVKTETGIYTETGLYRIEESTVNESEEEKSELDASAENAIRAVETNYIQYKNVLRSLGSNVTKEDIERLEELSKTIRITSYSLSKPTTPENMLENLMAKNIINPEFKMAFTSMFDNLIEDPLTYFFAKYEGATTIDHKGRPLVLKFQFERKLYSMCFKYVNPNAGLGTEKLDKLFNEALAEFYNIRLSFLKDLLDATGDLPTFIKLVQDNDINEHGLSAQFYDYFYKKIAAFKTLASTYEADVFANNPTVAKCKEMESSIDEIITKIQEWLTKSKTNIAKLFYNQLQ